MIYRANFSICSDRFWLGGPSPQQGQKRAHLEQSRTDVRSGDKFDALDLRLSEHNPKVFLFRGRRIRPQQLDGLGLHQTTSSSPTQTEEGVYGLTYLTPYVVQQPGEDVFRDRENIRCVPLVHPVPYELLERCLLLLFPEQQWGGGHRYVVVTIVVAWGIPELVLECVVAAIESGEKVVIVVHDAGQGRQ